MPSKTRRTAVKPQIRKAKQARSKATVAAIVEAAARILAEEGLAKLTTNAVAERAGVSIGSVYEYFPNKRAIIDQVLDKHLSRGEQIVREQRSNLVPPRSPDEIVRLLVSSSVDLHQDDPRLHRVLSSEIPLDPEQHARVDALRNAIIITVGHFLKNQVHNPELKATMLVDACDALTHRWLVDEVGVPVPPEVMANELEAMLSAYLNVDRIC